MTGADFYALMSEGFVRAVRRSIHSNSDQCIIEQNDLLDALASLSLSVAPEELKHYEDLALQWSTGSIALK